MGGGGGTYFWFYNIYHTGWEMDFKLGSAERGTWFECSW